ncbi:hypothetical protein RhiJN_10300 [Ceratobasidium sp. AG-Ba]|nr:hypothetical protein RhiJN_10300 [Ceratobasidium sp. AG-Ba]QRW11050.1 hypothetical protein RhiLY_10049 [Ceratobasidium sp. AG-Ba]
MNNLLLNTATYTLNYAPFPQSDQPQPHEGEFVTAPAKEQPISLSASPLLEPPTWRILLRQDDGPELYTIVNAPRLPPPDTAQELGFSNKSIAPGTPITLSDPTHYALKPTPFTVPNAPLLVTIHPEGPNSDAYCVAPAEDGTLQIKNVDPEAPIQQGWLITPATVVP